MKIATLLLVAALGWSAAPSAEAQAYPAGSQIQRVLRSDRGALGNLRIPGQIFATPVAMAPNAPNPAVAAVGIYQAGTLARNAAYAATAVCAADAGEFLADMGEDAEGAQAYLQGYPVREALGVFQWTPGYVILIARLRNGSEVQMRHYPLKMVAPNRYCLTRDLVADVTLQQVAGLMLANINGQLY